MDVTPVMNMFIILIPFLVSMAVFSQLAVLRFSLPGEGSIGRVSEETELPLTLALGAQTLTLIHGDRVIAEIFREQESAAFATLDQHLTTLSATLPDKDDIIIAVDDGVAFGRIVAGMDCCRGAGFTEIALAEGTTTTPGVQGGGDAAN